MAGSTASFHLISATRNLKFYLATFFRVVIRHKSDHSLEKEPSKMGISSALLVVGLGFVPFIPLLSDAQAQQNPCPPSQFHDINLSKRNSLVRLIQISNISKDQFTNENANAQTGMTIPYIDTPAKGDFAYTKDAVDMLRQQMGLNFTDSEDETILRIGLSESGLAAYKTCIENAGFEIAVTDVALTAPKFFATLSWHSNTGEKGHFTQVPAAIGGQITNPPDPNFEMNPNDQYSLAIDRDVKETFQLVASVNGRHFEIDLPPVSTKVLKTEAFSGPSVTAHADRTTHYNDVQPMCTPSPPGRFFVKGTEVAAIEHQTTSGQEGVGVKSMQVTPQLACITVEAHTGDAHIATDIFAHISVLTAWIADGP